MSKAKIEQSERLRFSVIAEIGEVPERIRVFREGWGYAKKGDHFIKFYCDREAYDSIMEEAKLRAHDICFDYEHQSEGAPYAVANGPTEAAGWINWQTGFEYVDGDGLYANVAWLPDAADLIRTKKYRYFSPSFNRNIETGRIISISSLALTNHPATLQQQPLAAKDGSAADMTPDICKKLGLPVTAGEEDVLSAIDALLKRPEGETKMSDTTKTDNDIAIAAAKLLGLEGVTDAESFKAKFNAAAKPVAAPENSAQLKAINEEIIALKADNAAKAKNEEAANAKLKDFETRWAARDEQDFIDEGRKLGKIVPANEKIFRTMFKAGADDARAALKDAPPIVSVGGKVSGDGGGSGNFDTAKAEVEKAVATKLSANPGMARSDAFGAVMSENEPLRLRYIEEANAGRGVKA